MKKILSVLILCLLTICTLSITACDDDENGTYYPDKSEMSYNLMTNGYQTYATSILAGDGTGTFLSATKDGDYIKFYWLDNADDCDYYYKLLEENNSDYNVLAKIENDDNFGNLVYCGTENAINAAGIKVVKVKV